MERELDNIRLPWPNWKVVRILGRGSFGRVYEIQKSKDGHISKAALKVMKIPPDLEAVYSLRADGVNDQKIDDYFHKEALRLKNEIVLMEELETATNIVTIKDSQILKQNDGVGYELYIMMELLTSLDRYCYGSNRKKSLTVEDVIKMGCDICDALSACEKKSIIHRDIKPSNIFVSEYEEYKLGDFGVSRQKEHTHTNMSLQGTVNYMAPEIYRNEKHYDGTVDIYSLGLVLYRLLNWGRLPFVRKDGEAPTYDENAAALTLRMSGRNEFPDPALGGRNLANVLRKACSFLPTNRYQRAGDFKKDLLKCAFSLDKIELEKEIIRADNDRTEPIRQNKKIENKTVKNNRPIPGRFPYDQEPPTVPIQHIQVQDSWNIPPVEPRQDPPKPKKKKWAVVGIASAICLLLVAGVSIGVYIKGKSGSDAEISVAKEESNLSPSESETEEVVIAPTDTPIPTNTSEPAVAIEDIEIQAIEIPTIAPVIGMGETLLGESEETDSSTQEETSNNYMKTFVFDSDSRAVLGNSDFDRYFITNIVFSDSLSMASENAWDVSEMSNGSVLAWVEDYATIQATLYIAQEGGVKIKDGTGLFLDYIFVENIDLRNLDISQAVSMNGMFAYTAITNLDLSNFDTSHVTDMSRAFERCDMLQELDLSSFDTSQVTHMSDMFHNCVILSELDLSSFDVSNVKDASSMFEGCSSLTEYKGTLNFSDDTEVSDIYKDSGLE